MLQVNQKSMKGLEDVYNDANTSKAALKRTKTESEIAMAKKEADDSRRACEHRRQNGRWCPKRSERRWRLDA